MKIQSVGFQEKDIIKEVVLIHLATFKGFFLTFMGKGFLYEMYKSYVSHEKSELIVAYEQGQVVGFLAYSSDLSGLYKFMIKHRLIPFAWYALGAFFRKPKVFLRLIRAFLKPKDAKREENYIELSSIGVLPQYKSQGVGTKLIDYLKQKVDFNKFAYIALETDAVNNDGVNKFYIKNGFVLEKTFATRENRLMNEYRYYNLENS